MQDPRDARGLARGGVLCEGAPRCRCARLRRRAVLGLCLGGAAGLALGNLFFEGALEVR
jgi:hypothetical protein